MSKSDGHHRVKHPFDKMGSSPDCRSLIGQASDVDNTERWSARFCMSTMGLVCRPDPIAHASLEKIKKSPFASEITKYVNIVAYELRVGREATLLALTC